MTGAAKPGHSHFAKNVAWKRPGDIPRVAFLFAFGSFLGQWYSGYGEDFLRTCLATENSVLLAGTAYAFAPWITDRVHAGAPVHALLTDSAERNASVNARLTFLLGDPCLLEHPLLAPSAFNAKTQAGITELSWTASPEATRRIPYRFGPSQRLRHMDTRPRTAPGDHAIPPGVRCRRQNIPPSGSGQRDQRVRPVPAVDRPQLCSTLIRLTDTERFNGIVRAGHATPFLPTESFWLSRAFRSPCFGLEPLALYLLAFLLLPTALDTMKQLYVGWILGMALGCLRGGRDARHPVPDLDQREADPGVSLGALGLRLPSPKLGHTRDAGQRGARKTLRHRLDRRGGRCQ